MEGPTYISSDFVNQKDAEFPAITVCPESNGYKLDVLKSHGIPEKERYRFLNSALPISRCIWKSAELHPFMNMIFPDFGDSLRFSLIFFDIFPEYLLYFPRISFIFFLNIFYIFPEYLLNFPGIYLDFPDFIYMLTDFHTVFMEFLSVFFPGLFLFFTYFTEKCIIVFLKGTIMTKGL
jgi:hypothetical protein